MVIYANSSEEEEEKPSLLTGAITTLQRSSQFKNLFDLLEFTANKWTMATEALVSIALRVGIEYLTIETRPN